MTTLRVNSRLRSAIGDLELGIPVPCVDVLRVRKAAGGNIEVGLIYRDTRHQGSYWCIIDGYLLRTGSLRAAVTRENRDSLGKTVRCFFDGGGYALFVAEYFFRRAKGNLLTSRQHASGLTFGSFRR